MISKRSNKQTLVEKIQGDLVEYIDMKRQLEPFLVEIQEAIEDVQKTGKLTKLRKLAVTVETVRIMGEFKRAVEEGDLKRMEYFGKLIRDHFMDRPKVSLEHSASEGTGVGVVVLPARDKGEAE